MEIKTFFSLMLKAQMIKPIAERAGACCICSSFSQHLGCAGSTGFPEAVLQCHSSSTLLCLCFFPHILPLLFSSKVNDAFPVVCSCPASPSPAAAAGSTQAQLCPNPLVTSARTAQAPAVPQCWPQFLLGCQDQEDPGIQTTETPQGGA